jgi:group I intron endonuclease
MNVTGYIYRVTNTVNGRIYIGQTRRTVAYRWSVHKSEALRRPKCYFHKAIAKHGHEVFRVEVIATAGTVSELDALECRFIAEANSADPSAGYNLTLGGGNAVRTEAARRNNAEARRGKPLSDATKRKMSEARRGRKQSDAHRLARSLALKGRKPSAAARVAVAESNRRRRKVAA